MKKLRNLFCCLFVLTLLVGCASNKPVVVQNENTNTKTITQTVHDTIFKIAKDSSSLAALIECQNGKAVIKNITQFSPGRNLKIPKIRIENNVLQIDCEARANELLAQYKSTQIASNSTKTRTNTIEVNKLTFLQELQIYCFWAIVATVVMVILFNYIKSKL